MMAQQEKSQDANSQNIVPDHTVSSDSSSDSNAVDSSAPRKKSIAFYLTFLAILVNLFLYALDATALAVATPVSHPDILSQASTAPVRCADS